MKTKKKKTNIPNEKVLINKWNPLLYLACKLPVEFLEVINSMCTPFTGKEQTKKCSKGVEYMCAVLEDGEPKNF